ncbi:DUF1345 domain-containing protein [Roseateles koreensis]|uniref:DUF1345 domain-containing protein n=1 Tax=Roseateles koreensis TaxID=2987526 RepID=A0ABT5KP79_9BURK|nr:DUF1345 domain-containing protein [Roseateles koreensis]MDC8784724.1 DUF1345 domain-containing protein [Roseateles koreensis]
MGTSTVPRAITVMGTESAHLEPSVRLHGRRRGLSLQRLMRARPRLFLAGLVAVLVGLFMPAEVATHVVTRGLIVWNTGSTLYVLLAGVMMMRSDQAHMHGRAQHQDDGQLFIMVMVFVSALASLGAIAFELAVVKDMHGVLKTVHIALAGYTVLASWAFIQVMFALHYAHEYYAAVQCGQPGGLLFPTASGGADELPDYGDFFYFAAVIGTSGQTADVSFTAKHLRRIGTLHCILAYLFNTTVLALLINIGAGLF